MTCGWITRAVGEIFLCSEETNGIPEVLPHFLGKAITGFGGGCSKMFVMEGKAPFSITTY